MHLLDLYFLSHTQAQAHTGTGTAAGLCISSPADPDTLTALKRTVVSH